VARHNVRELANGQNWTRWYGIPKEVEVEDGKTFGRKHSKRKLSNNDSIRHVLLLKTTELWCEATV
jgi:hypothetical protein